MLHRKIDLHLLVFILAFAIHPFNVQCADSAFFAHDTQQKNSFINRYTIGSACLVVGAYCAYNHIQNQKVWKKVANKMSDGHSHNQPTANSSIQIIVYKLALHDPAITIGDIHNDSPKELPVLLRGSGYLRSIMLYPDENKTVCAIQLPDWTYKLLLFAINTEQNTCTCIAEKTVPHLFKKTVYLGPYNKKESFLGLTEQGQLALIWLTTLNKEQLAAITTLNTTVFGNNTLTHTHTFEYILIEYKDKLVGGKSVDRQFFDIAVDGSVQKNNVRHRIACLNTN